MGEVVHGRVIEVEGIGELLIVVGHEGEAEVAILRAAEPARGRSCLFDSGGVPGDWSSGFEERARPGSDLAGLARIN